MADRTRRVCVVGSLNMDLVVRTPRFPAMGETVLGGDFSTFPGGKGANQAVAAARMGARVTMIGRVGSDSYGAQLQHVLDNEGIDTTAVRTTPGSPTGVAIITVAEGGGNTIVVVPGANGRLTPADIDAAQEWIQAAEVLLVQLEVPLEAVQRAAEIAHRAGRLVMLNAAPAPPLSVELLRLVDVLVVNETEARVICADRAETLELVISAGAALDDMTGGKRARPAEQDGQLVSLLARIAGCGPGSIVVTLGERGAAWIRGSTARMVRPFRVQPVDTVGAGDAFCGALASAWPRRWAHAKTVPVPAEADDGNQEMDALALAAAAGALATTRRGAIPSLPRREEVEQFPLTRSP